MFDITSSKLLILAVVALIVVGPKDLPVLLRTIGKYLGVIRRQAAEFRSQFDEAIRETELEQLKKEFESASREVRATMDAGARKIDEQLAAASAKPEAAKIAAAVSEPASVPHALAAGEGSAPATDDSSKESAEPEQEPGRGAA
ncbi:MAG: Sec-independent protein translocase protein TatB [Hyphomicrobium sp.]|jgi:sec-independent protein translocase protein TatB